MVGSLIVKGASVATAFFNHHIGSGQNAVAKNFLARGREIRPFAGLRRRSLGNDAGNYLVALPEFHSFAGTQPSLQPFGVAELANVYAGHYQNCGTHCGTLSKARTRDMFFLWIDASQLLLADWRSGSVANPPSSGVE